MSTTSAEMTRRAAVLGALVGLLGLSGCLAVVDDDDDHYHYHRRRRGRRRRYRYYD
jgi:hypothetical protein